MTNKIKHVLFLILFKCIKWKYYKRKNANEFQKFKKCLSVMIF